MGRDRNHTTHLQVVGSGQREAPKVPGFERLAFGTYGEVWCSVEDLEFWTAHGADPNRKRMQEHAKLTRHFQRFADVGTKGFPEDAFKPQGKQKSGHQSVQVWAFKAYQYRLYGILTSRSGVPCFVGLSTDPSKQDNKADPDRLKRVAERVPEWGNGGSEEK